jgi:hypothetical protein
MTAILDACTEWLRTTEVSEAIRSVQWLWPACEIAHFVGLSVLVGVIGFFDLRLLGVVRGVPISAAWSLMPWGKAGFGLVAGLNALCFERLYGAIVKGSGSIDATPPAYRVIAIVSIVSWLLVIYWGRMLPFVGNAF